MITAAIIAAALSVGVDPNLLLSLCFVESSHRNVVSPIDGKSASYGVCQLKLNTARLFNKHIHPSDLLNPQVNARISALYLKKQINRYKGNIERAVAAYNSGTTRFDNNGAIKNIKYVAKVFNAQKERPWIRSEHSVKNQRQLAMSSSTSAH